MMETRKQAEKRIKAELGQAGAIVVTLPTAQPTAKPDNPANTSTPGKTGPNVDTAIDSVNKGHAASGAIDECFSSPNEINHINSNNRNSQPANLTTPKNQSQGATSSVKASSTTPPPPKIEVDTECDCKECNPKYYGQWPHAVNPKDKECKYTFRTCSHLPLCNLVDLYSHEPTAVVGSLIESFSKKGNAFNDPAGKPSENSTLGKRKSETGSSSEKEYEDSKDEKCNDGRTGEREIDGPREGKSKDDGESEEEMRRQAFTDAVKELKEWSANRPGSLKRNPERMSSATLQYLFELLNNIFFLQSLRGTKVVRKSLKHKGCIGLTVTPSFDAAVDDGHESSLPIITIYIDPQGCIEEPGATSKGRKDAFPLATPRRRHSPSSHTSYTSINFIIGTLLHEMAHAFISLFVCRGQVYAYPDAGLNNECHSKLCKSIHRFNLGQHGHGRVWWRLATAIENNSYRILGFKTPVIASRDLENELSAPNGWLPTRRHDIPEFFEKDKKSTNAIEKARKERAQARAATIEQPQGGERVRREESPWSDAVEQSCEQVKHMFTTKNYGDALFLLNRAMLPKPDSQTNHDSPARVRSLATTSYQVSNDYVVGTDNACSNSQGNGRQQATSTQDLKKARKRRKLSARGSSETTQFFQEGLGSDHEDDTDVNAAEEANITTYRYMCLLK